MAQRTLAENVAQVKADFKAVKDAVPYVFNDNPPTSEYGERIFTEISSLQYQADSAWDQGFNNGMEQGRTEGIEQGKQEVISNSKYIEKSASGKGVFLNDVSEVAHKVKVKADTETEVKVYGKNLFDISTDTRLTKQADGSYINNAKLGTAKIPLSLPNGSYMLSYDLSCPSGKNARIRVYLKDGSYKETSTSSNGGFVHFETSIVGEIESWGFYYGAQPEAETMVIKNAQIEFGSATEYEPYTEQTITATPEGTEIPSNCPIMTFLADNDVTVDYFGSYGMKTEYDRFWDNFQKNGTRRDYTYGFCGLGWNDNTFKPKYSLLLTSSSQVFYTAQITDLVAILNEQGVELNTSKCAYLSYFCGYSKTITTLPRIDLSLCTNTTYMCAGATGLVSIEKIISSEKTVFANNAFNNCTALEHCIFEGTIASNINLQWSTKLDMESLGSLFRCLKNFNNDEPDNAHTKTITLSAESWALLDTYVYENGWNDYANAKDVIGAYLGWNYA